MTLPLRGDAAIRYTEDGQDYLHYLGGPLRNPRKNTRQQVFSWWSADLTTNRVISIGSGVEDLAATLSWDGSPDSLDRLIAAGRRGATLDYFPSLSEPALNFPCVLVEAGEIGPDPQFWHARRFTVDVVLRRIDGGSWQAALEAPLFYYRAGYDVPGLTFTRSGSVGPYTDEDGVLQAAAANIVRTEWLWLDDQVGAPDTPALLIEAARTNLVDSDDISAWSVSGTPVVTATIDDPAGGTGAYRVADDDGAAAEFVLRNITFTGDATKAMSFTVREATMPAAGHLIKLRDTTAGADRLSIGISAWTDGEPTVGASTGTVLGQRSAGNGYWVIYVRTAAVTAANTNRVEIYPAVTAAQTGSLDVYRVNAFDNTGAPSYSILDASEARAADTLYATFGHLQQPLTAYVKMVEMGTGYMVGGNAGVLHIGGDNAGEDPRLSILHDQAATAGCYTVLYDNGIDAAVTAVIANGNATAYGDVVELLCQLDYNEDGDGDLRIYQSKNAGTTTTAVTASGPAAGLNPDREWHLSPARLYLGSRESTERGQNPILSVKVVAGIQDMTYMRAL